MVLILRIIGWGGLVTSLLNAGIKLFADAESVARYAGSSRDIDSNITVAAFCLIFFALAAILSELKALREKS
jgi:hypothetical protein